MAKFHIIYYKWLSNNAGKVPTYFSYLLYIIMMMLNSWQVKMLV